MTSETLYGLVSPGIVKLAQVTCLSEANLEGYVVNRSNRADLAAPAETLGSCHSARSSGCWSKSLANALTSPSELSNVLSDGVSLFASRAVGSDPED